MSSLNDGMYTSQVKNSLPLSSLCACFLITSRELLSSGRLLCSPVLKWFHLCSSRNSWTTSIINFFMESVSSLRAQPNSFIMLAIGEMALSALRKCPGLFRRTALLSLSSVSLYLTKLTVWHYIMQSTNSTTISSKNTIAINFFADCWILLLRWAAMMDASR